MATLPHEMISDILCRLPVKSLLRFQCTSKPFCSMINGPDFIKLHLNRSTQTNSNQRLVIWNYPLFSIDLPSLERVVEIDHPLKTPKCNTKLLGSCNGLLCLLNSDSESQVVLWNMSTGYQHRLPHIHIIFPRQANIISFHQVAYGFGYDSVHDDYKLVRIVRFCDTFDSEVMLYSLKSNSWKNLLCGFPYDLPDKRTVGMFAEGVLHWLVNYPLIAAFDLATEEFRELSPPPESLCDEPYRLYWRVFEGRLCVISNRVAKGAEIWMMKHNDSSWTKWLSISHPQLTLPHCFVPMAYLGNANELLLLQDFNKFLPYDLKRNKIQNVRIHNLPPPFDAMPYVESLVKPFPMANATAGKNKSKKNAAKRDDFLSKGFKLVL